MVIQPKTKITAPTINVGPVNTMPSKPVLGRRLVLPTPSPPKPLVEIRKPIKTDDQGN